MFFDSCIVDPEELIGASHHVNIEVLAICAFLVGELVDRSIKCGLTAGHKT